MRPALIVGGVAVLAAGAWWLYTRNKRRAQLRANMAAIAERARARAFLADLSANPLIRSTVSPAVILQNEVSAGVHNRATAGNFARLNELNLPAASVP